MEGTQELQLESFTSVTESYYTYTSPNQSPGPSPTFSRKDNYDLTNNLSIISRVPSLSNSRFSLERTVQSEAFEATQIDNYVNENQQGIPWKSILFGFLLIAGIVCVTSIIIIVPRNNETDEEEDNLPRTPTCSSFGTNVGDGFCDDHLNTRTCDFDGGDCCLNTTMSRERCTDCKCALDEDEAATEFSIIQDMPDTPVREFIKFGEICEEDKEGNTECYPTGAVQFGAKSSKYYISQ